MYIIPSKRMEIKKKLISDCPECSGRSCQTCLRQLTIVDKFAEANIPVNYWFFKMKDYKGDEAKLEIVSYIENLKENIQKGQGLCFAGTYGTGKTTGLCAILKSGVFNNYDCYYTTLNDLIMYSMDYETKSEYMYLVHNAQLLAIDEIDARHFSSSEEAQKMIGSAFEKLIRYRIQNSLPVLAATNHPSLDDAFTGQHKRVIDSLLLSKMKSITVLGKDQRKG